MKKRFSEREKVMAADGGNVYPAMIIKCKEIGTVRKYFIHYLGWSRKYDTWVDESLTAPCDDAIAITKLSNAVSINPVASPQKDSNSSKKGKSATTSVVDAAVVTDSDSKDCSANGSSGVTTAVEADAAKTNKKGKTKKGTAMAAIVETRHDKETVRAMNSNRKELMHADLAEDDDESQLSRVEIPHQLKKHLMEEWVLITKETRRPTEAQMKLLQQQQQQLEEEYKMQAQTLEQKQKPRAPPRVLSITGTSCLLKLPRQHTVESIVEDFLDFKRKQKDMTTIEIWKYEEVMKSLQAYFNKALPTILLYRQERDQYDHIMAKINYFVQNSASSSSSSSSSAASASNTATLMRNTADCPVVVSGGSTGYGFMQNAAASTVYGAEHLIRLYVRLPKLLANVFLPMEQQNDIVWRMMELLKFVRQHANKYLDITDYLPDLTVMEQITAFDVLKWKSDEAAAKQQRSMRMQKWMVRGGGCSDHSDSLGMGSTGDQPLRGIKGQRKTKKSTAGANATSMKAKKVATVGASKVDGAKTKKRPRWAMASVADSTLASVENENTGASEDCVEGQEDGENSASKRPKTSKSSSGISKSAVTVAVSPGSGAVTEKAERGSVDSIETGKLPVRGRPKKPTAVAKAGLGAMAEAVGEVQQNAQEGCAANKVVKRGRPRKAVVGAGTIDPALGERKKDSVSTVTAEHPVIQRKTNGGTRAPLLATDTMEKTTEYREAQMENSYDPTAVQGGADAGIALKSKKRAFPVRPSRGDSSTSRSGSNSSCGSNVSKSGSEEQPKKRGRPASVSKASSQMTKDAIFKARNASSSSSSATSASGSTSTSPPIIDGVRRSAGGRSIKTPKRFVQALDGDLE